jgi:HEAT repeat protein
VTGLEIPGPPHGVPYADREDAAAARLLEVNGLPSEGAALRALLGDGERPVVASAAARRLGVLDDREAEQRLRELADSDNDLLAVHAAAGLSRLDPEAGAAALRKLVTLPPDAYPGAIQAAGELARTGDLAGEPTVFAALESEIPVLRTIAAKQLYFLAEAGSDAARERLEALRGDPDPGLAALARSQLDALDG